MARVRPLASFRFGLNRNGLALGAGAIKNRVGLHEFYVGGPSSISISYAIPTYIHAAVHTPDRVTTGVKMSIPSNIGEARETRGRDTGLQFVVANAASGHGARR